MKIDSVSHWKINNKTKEKTKQKRKIDEFSEEVQRKVNNQIKYINYQYTCLLIIHFSLCSLTLISW